MIEALCYHAALMWHILAISNDPLIELWHFNDFATPLFFNLLSIQRQLSTKSLKVQKSYDVFRQAVRPGR